MKGLVRSRSINSIDDILESKIGPYKLDKKYYPDRSLPEYKRLASARECASLYYGYHNPEEIRVTIFQFDKHTENYLEAIRGETIAGFFSIYANVCYLTKDEFAIIITTLENTLKEKEGFELLRHHYINKFGFC